MRNSKPIWPSEADVRTQDIDRSRTCVECKTPYTIAEFLASSEEYFRRPHDYASGCLTYCLTCWLVAGLEEAAHEHDEGDVLRDCGFWLKPGVHLAVMPIARVSLNSPMTVTDSNTVFYPAGTINLVPLNVLLNDPKSKNLAESQSASSGVNVPTFDGHALVAFPVAADWDSLWRTDHRSHMEFVRYLSSVVDHQCLDLIRYLQCTIEPVDALPGRAGQLDSNHMMAGALIYNAARIEARIIGGAAFTHIITRGLGLPIESIDHDRVPKDGETGNIVRQALALYGDLIEVNSATSKFTLAMSLLEFLAYPTEYRRFQDVKKIVARYVAHDARGYQRILDRFEELTHKRDPNSKEGGYRTRLVHMGDRLEALVRNASDRRTLFEELDGYIRAIIDNMIAHSALTLDEYVIVRDQLKPFAT